MSKHSYLVVLSFPGESFAGWLHSTNTTATNKPPKKALRDALADAMKELELQHLRMTPLVSVARGMHCTALGIRVEFSSTKQIASMALHTTLAQGLEPFGKVLNVEVCDGSGFEDREVIQSYTAYLYSAESFIRELSRFAAFCPFDLTNERVDHVTQVLSKTKDILNSDRQAVLEVSASVCVGVPFEIESSPLLAAKTKIVELRMRGYGQGFRDFCRCFFAAAIRDVLRSDFDLTSLRSLDPTLPLLKLRHLFLCETTPTTLQRPQMKREARRSANPSVKSPAKPPNPVSNEATSQEREKLPLKSRLDGHYMGNFKSYYVFNPSDLRIKKLHCDVFRDMVRSKQVESFLDLGCNQGDLTVAIHKMLIAETGKLETLGVDVDAALIRSAEKLHADVSDVCSFKTCDVMKQEERYSVLADRKYDVVACFGLTMWIHLNHGDNGLINFMGHLKDLTKHILILEPQAWKSYRAAKSRIRRAGGNLPSTFTSLEVTGDAVEQLLDSSLATGPLSFDRRLDLGKTEWGRQIYVYTRAQEIASATD